MIAAPVSAIPKLVIAEAGNFPELARFYLDEVVHRSTAVIGRVVRAGIDRGEFRAVDSDAAVMCILAPVVLAMLWRHSLGLYEQPGLDPEALCNTHTQLLLDGLTVPPEAAEAGQHDGTRSKEATR